MKNCINLKSSLFLLLFVWCTNIEVVRSLRHTSTIMTSSGPVQGSEIEFRGHMVKQYLGIPFAEPPVGEFRFKKPRPVIKQSKVILADTMPPACIQYTEYPFPWYDFQDGKSEDCLYLNIWVPQTFLSNFRIRKIPVMFWIYGGGFTIGSNRIKDYEGQALASEGDVIVVTINYRMGVFGFLTSGTEAAPGNVGIYDMVEALKWVNSNIGAFGGDPAQVTIAGQGAGSQSVSLLCVSPLTKGLFQRVIMESGSAAYLSAENNTANIAKSQKVAEAVSCADENTSIFDDPEKVVNCLTKVDALKLAIAIHSFHPKPGRSFFPNYGDEILPQNARVALISGDFHNVDVLIGNNRDEGVFQITSSHTKVFGFFGEKNPKISKTYGNKLLKNTFKDLPNTEEAINHYLGNVSDNDYYRIRHQVYTGSGDYSLLCPDVYFAESYSRAGNKVFFYFFVHRPSNTPWANWTGVVHYEEVQFVFGIPIQEPRNYTVEEVRLSRKMVNIWTNFVKYGDPGYFRWPLYSRENPIYYKLNTDLIPEYGKGPHRRNCDFFREDFGFL